MLYKKHETEIRLHQVVPNHASTEVSKKSIGFKTFKKSMPYRKVFLNANAKKW
jgi:hypothetical protein